MSFDWPLVRLGEHCTKIGSGATPSGGSNVYTEEGEICLIRSQNIHNGGFKSDGLVFISSDAANKLKNVIVEADDVLLNITGDSVARVCLARKEYLPARVNQHVAIIRPDERSFDARYLCYQLSSPKMQAFLLGIAAVGATRNALTKGMIEDLDVIKPPITVQKTIADKLESLDKKIELNRQTNQTLEQIAQALFKSWFVDFEPTRAKIAARESGASPEEIERAAMCAISGKTPEQLAQLPPETQQNLKTTAALFPDSLVDSELGEIPAGWEVSDIDRVCHFQNGCAIDTKDMVKTPQDAYKIFKMGGIKKGGGLNQNSTKDYLPKEKSQKLDRYVLKRGDLLMCMTDMKNNVALLAHTALMDVDDQYVVNQRVGLLRTKDRTRANYSFLYLLSNSESFITDLRNRANSGVQVNLSTFAIKATRFVLPTPEVHQEFDAIVQPIFTKIFSMEAEENQMGELRDALLPKLLSGEISIDSQLIDLHGAL